MNGTEILTLAGLSFLSIEDIRTKQVPVTGILLLGMGLLLCRLWERTEFLPMALGVVPGLLAMLLAVATKEQIGLGDGLVLVALGFGNDMVKVISMLCAAFFLAGIWAVLLLVIKKTGKKQSFPFLPFLLAGYGIVLFLK